MTMPGPNSSISTSRTFLESKSHHPATIRPSPSLTPSPHDLLVTTSGGVSRWGSDGTVVQSFRSPDAGVVASVAVSSGHGKSERDMLALADSQIILLVHPEDGAVRKSYGLKGDEVMWPRSVLAGGGRATEYNC